MKLLEKFEKGHVYLTYFTGGLDSKESVCSVGELSSIPGLGRSPGKGNGNPLQYSCLGNSMERGALWAVVHGVAKSWIQLSDYRTTATTRVVIMIK